MSSLTCLVIKALIFTLANGCPGPAASSIAQKAVLRLAGPYFVVYATSIACTVLDLTARMKISWVANGAPKQPFENTLQI